MEALLKSIWVQAGAFGLLAVTGWAVAWMERKRADRLEDRSMRTNERLLTVLTENTAELIRINERLK